MSKNQDPVTKDMADFGHRELCMARDLLNAYLEHNDTKFLGDGVHICMNRNSGYVFLSDEDYNVAMEADGHLLDWLTSPYEGKEGFFDDLLDEYASMHEEDKEWLRDIAKSYGKELPIATE